MKLFISIMFSCFIWAFAAQADTGNFVDPIFNVMAMEAMTAIQKSDNDYFLKYVAEEGIVIAGNTYSKEKITTLLKDKHSLLFKHLYSGKSSIKHFFNTDQNPNVSISQKSSNSIAIIYTSKNSSERRTIQNCYIKISGTWYLEGIFSCE